MSGSGPTARHTAVLATEASEIPADRRPEPGEVAILPSAPDDMVSAVRAGGGIVGALGAATRGIVWLSYERAGELAQILRTNPQVGWVQLPWAGVDGFAATLASDELPGRLFTSAKGAYAQPVAEHALTLSLALLREIPNRVRATRWTGEKAGRSLYRANVVIIGAGGIARELISLLAPFSAEITVVRRSVENVPGAARVVRSEQMCEVLPEADLVVLAAALTAGTRHVVGEKELALMKPTAYLVNIARGALVDTAALTDALADGQLAGAALDVTDPEPLPDGHPLWAEPRCLITPHSADTPEMTEPLLAERIRQNVQAFTGHGRFVGVVDRSLGY